MRHDEIMGVYEAQGLDVADADHVEHLRSWKTRRTAVKKADDFAAIESKGHATRGVPFRATYWNGHHDEPIWLMYAVSETDEGWTVTAYRWKREWTVPQERDEDE